MNKPSTNTSDRSVCRPQSVRSGVTVMALSLAAGLISMAATSCRTSASRALDANNQGALTVSTAQRASWAVRMGLTVVDGSAGATASAVAPAMYASVIGVKAGDTITALNGITITKASDFDTVANGFAGNTQTAATWNGLWALSVQRGTQPLSIGPVA